MTGWRGPGTTWDGGKSDDHQIAQAEQLLLAAVPPEMRLCVDREPYLLLPRDGTRPFLLTSLDNLEPEALEKSFVVRHPDVCLTIKGRPALIVELDGSWHDTLPGRKATDRRDRDYRAAGLPCIAIRLSEYPEDGAWQAELRRRLKCMKYIPPRASGGEEAA